MFEIRILQMTSFIKSISSNAITLCSIHCINFLMVRKNLFTIQRAMLPRLACPLRGSVVMLAHGEAQAATDPNHTSGGIAALEATQ